MKGCNYAIVKILQTKLKSLLNNCGLREKNMKTLRTKRFLR